MIALSDVLQGMSRANSWALFALSPTYLIRPVLILVFMAAALLAGYRPDAETAIIVAILATYATTIWPARRRHRAASTASMPAGPRTRAFPRMVRRVAADLPGRELLLPAHQCRRADGRLLHAARRRRGLFRHGEDAGAGAFRLFRRQGRRRPALCRLHPWRPGQARGLRPRDRVVDVLAVARHGARRAGARQADADAVRPGLRRRLPAAVPAGRRRRRARRRSARPRACSP